MTTNVDDDRRTLSAAFDCTPATRLRNESPDTARSTSVPPAPQPTHVSTTFATLISLSEPSTSPMFSTLVEVAVILDCSIIMVLEESMPISIT